MQQSPTAASRQKLQTTVDLLGRVVSSRDEWGFVTTTTYDQAGRVTQTFTKDPSTTTVQTMLYAFVGSGFGVNQVASITSGAPVSPVVVFAQMSYDSLGRVTTTTYSNGTTKTAPTYDAYLRPTLTEFKKGATALYSEVTGFNPMSGRVIDTAIGGVQSYAWGDDYTYDKAGRLVNWWTLDAAGGRVNSSAQYSFYSGGTPGCGNAQWGRNSNRLSQVSDTYNAASSLTGTKTDQYCYDNADRLTSFIPGGGAPNPFTGLAYDIHGSITAMGGEVHGFDSADRHLVTKKGATTVTYVRDVAGRVIQRSVNGTVVARYSFAGAGDSSGLTLSATNAVVETTQGLPGGVLLTRTGATYKWSYPNRHGDVIFATDNTGTMIGGRTTFDPFGNQIGAVAPVDNSTGSWDYGWHGTAQRPLESQAGLTPIIEMGARQYTSVLGRFLETDPIEGGTPNDYTYPSDPINTSDLTGSIKRIRRLAYAKDRDGGVDASIWTINRTPQDRANGYNRAMFEIKMATYERMITLGGSVAIVPVGGGQPAQRTLSLLELGSKGAIHTSIAGQPGTKYMIYGFWQGATYNVAFFGTFTMPHPENQGSN